MPVLVPDTKFNVQSDYRHAYSRVWSVGDGAWSISHYGYISLFEPAISWHMPGKIGMIIALVVHKQPILERFSVPELLESIKIIPESHGPDWLIRYEFSAPVQDAREVSLAIQMLAQQIAEVFHEAYETLDAAEGYHSEPLPLSNIDLALSQLIDESGLEDCEYPEDHDLTLGELMKREWLTQGF
jgi:hypothetical protein